MKSFTICVFLVFTGFSFVTGQNDTVRKQGNNLLGDLSALESKQSQDLLPKHMIFTQRLLWGEKGLMRGCERYKLTAENRERELKVRRTMLHTHQVMGVATLGCMAAQGIIGIKLFNATNRMNTTGSAADIRRHSNLLHTHRTMAGFTDFAYLSTASLSLFAPPKMIDERKGYSNIKVHKILAIVHFTGLVTTNILAAELYKYNKKSPVNEQTLKNLRLYHRAAAITTFTSLAAAMVIIKF